jgi:hypothetical protein
MVPHALCPATAPRSSARSASLRATASSGSAREASAYCGDPREQAVSVRIASARRGYALGARAARSAIRVPPSKAGAARRHTLVPVDVPFLSAVLRRLP